MTPRYVVLDTSTDLVLEARFRGNYYAHDWVYNMDDSSFETGSNSLFDDANRTNGEQTYTIPAGSASLRVGYYGPDVLPTAASNIDPTPNNTVIVGSFGKCTITNSIKHTISNSSVMTPIAVLVVSIINQFLYLYILMEYLFCKVAVFVHMPITEPYVVSLCLPII